MRKHVVGVDTRVPLVDGRSVPYVNLDNGATTPPLKQVLECTRGFYEWYSSVHRGAGFKSQLSTYVYEQCRSVIADFAGADLAHHAVIFTQNATDGLNHLAAQLAPPDDHVVVTTVMEHHSNLLPWRELGCRVEYARVRGDGALDLEDLEGKVKSNAGKLSMVTVSGASNVTGHMPPLRRIARLAHEHGAQVAVDATQLVARRPLSMGAPDDPERLDFVVFSGHKMYAPFGSGVLIGPKDFFERTDPAHVGGGMVSAVTLDDAMWAALPEREEAGTPNVPGAVALACAAKTLLAIGLDNIAEHERALTRRALDRLGRIDGLALFDSQALTPEHDRGAVVSMAADKLSHAKLAAVLGHEWGIGVRNGCFCAQPYVRELLGVSDHELQKAIEKLKTGDRSAIPGLVRMSLGMYNTADEIDYFVEALTSVLRDGPRASYVMDPKYHDYVPDAPVVDFQDYTPF